MKRLHVRVSVDDPAHSIQFDNTPFAVKPTVAKHGHANWMLDDRRVNFTADEDAVHGDSVDLGPIRAASCRTPETPQGASRAPKPELAAVCPCYRQGAAA
jgi:hypothetical protein